MSQLSDSELVEFKRLLDKAMRKPAAVAVSEAPMIEGEVVEDE